MERSFSNRSLQMSNRFEAQSKIPRIIYITNNSYSSNKTVNALFSCDSNDENKNDRNTSSVSNYDYSLNICSVQSSHLGTTKTQNQKYKINLDSKYHLGTFSCKSQSEKDMNIVFCSLYDVKTQC